MSSKEQLTQTQSGIRELLAQGRVPLLAFEARALQERLSKLGERQAQLGADLGEAMSESSETWHDNPRAEEVSMISRGTSAEAFGIQKALRSAVVVEPPTGEETQATLGSLVWVRFEGEDDQVPVLLTGYNGEITEEMRDQLPEIEVATVNSPLGNALLDSEPGQEVGYETNENYMKVLVDGIDIFDVDSLQYA